MKINKRLIIILIVAAVAAYLVWKHKKDEPGENTGTGETPTGNTPSAEDHATLGYILSHISFTDDERKKIEALRKQCETSVMTKQSIESKAYEKGHSFDQQIVLEAIWMLYNPSNSAWIAGPDGSTTYGWNLQQKVLNL